MHHLYLYIHFIHTCIWMQTIYGNHILFTKLLSSRRRKRRIKKKESNKRRAIILYEHYEHTRECINTPSQSSTTTHTYTQHTHLFVWLQFLEPGEHSLKHCMEIIYQMLPIYIYIYNTPYIFIWQYNNNNNGKRLLRFLCLYKKTESLSRIMTWKKSL